MITAENLTKRYGRNLSPALKDVSFQIDDGEIVGFAGLNGSGKTTTLRIISGIIVPTSGSVKIDGNDIVREKIAASSNLAIVPELPNFDITQKAIPLLRYYAGFYGMQREEADQRIETLLKNFGIWEYRNRKLRTYSQGMKKRFAIASALLSDPKNILFDETLNGLDPEGVRNIRNLMLEQKKQGKAVFLSSHILSELQNIADRVIIIKKGSIVKILDRSDIPNLGASSIRIMVSNPDSKINEILEQYGTVQQSGSEIQITDLKVSSEKAKLLNGELAKSGYIVTKYDLSGEGLEEYFLSLVRDSYE
ncbi:MAG: ABC transporter ATP-binding protein [Candidatus Thermoplasmatota archaeon]|nr:ABC transporter ATP-binding protein [Candidatus Thermoplasmatota archaeon]